MLFAFGWRNLWRNKRRTIIAISSVVFAVVIAVFMRSIQLGSYGSMIDGVVRQMTGYISVMGHDYWENRSIDESIVLDDALIRRIASVEHVTLVSPRFEGFALIAKGDLTKISQVEGIQPEKEHRMNGLRDKIVKGTYLTNHGTGIILGEGLARNIGADVGDSVVLYGQGYHGGMAAGIVPVTGIAKFPIPQQNNAAAFLALPYAQDLFQTYGMVTSIAVMIDNERYLDETSQKIKAIVKDEHTVMTWEEMMPEMVQAMQADEASGYIMLVILYVIIAFGMFGTVMMMTAERVREFGILIAVGMKRLRLNFVTTVEAVMISMLGAAGGFLLSIPVIWYFHLNPIRLSGDIARTYENFGMEPVIPVSIDPVLFLEQAAIVFLLALVTALYPVIYIRYLKPMNAIRG